MKLKYICQYCSKELTRHNSLVKHEKICKLNPENNYNTIYKCEYCNKIYTHKYAFNRHLKIHPEYNKLKISYIWQCKYCDNKCIFESRRKLEKHIKENHQNIKQVKNTYICQYCNHEIYNTISGFTNQENLCPKNPNRKLPDLNKCKSEEFRRQASERMKERHRLGLAATFQNRKNVPHSYPENWLIDVLKNNFNQIENIDYETERPFYRFFLDFAWPEKRLCIEIDGELNRYEKQQNNDKEKDRLLKEDGWKELRLKWGYINSNKIEAIKLIENFLNETGDITIPVYKTKREIWEEQHKENELNGVLKNKLGRFCPQKLTEDQWLKRKEIILNADVDLTKLGWKSEVERKTDLTRREICRTVEHFIDLQELCYKRG
ncbi:MAG: DUF559 domain-containing protein [Methanobrevibacter sp.]|nr:DUF559 domain-containing protein [Methanobrevibacter sp.]